MYLNGIVLHIEKFADFWKKKNAGISRNKKVCHVTHVVFGSSLGKV